MSVLSKAKYVILLADGSTDYGNIEDEVLLAIYCNPYTKDGTIHMCNKFLTVRHPAAANTEGYLLASMRN